MFHNKSINSVIYSLILFLPITFLIGSFFVNLVSLLVSSFTIVWLFCNKKLDILIKKQYIFFSVLFIIFLTSSTLSNYKIISLENSLSYYFNYILFLSLFIFLSEDENKLYYLSKIVFVIVIFLCIDLWIQKFLGFDIFGYPKQQAGRLTSVFKDEQIPGSVIFKFLPFIIFFLYRSKNLLFKKYKFLIFIFIYFSILITGERATSILATLLILLLLFFNFRNINKKKLILYCFLFLTIFFILFNLKNSIIKERIYFTIQQSKDNIYYVLYNNALEIFSNNIFAGTGPQTYRLECPKYLDNCSSHPHNFLLELLSDGGIFSPILFVISMISLIYYKIKNTKSNFLKSLIISFSILFFFPLIPTGSFFTSFHMTLIWFSLGFLYATKEI